jgi:hypothetical protein
MLDYPANRDERDIHGRRELPYIDGTVHWPVEGILQPANAVGAGGERGDARVFLAVMTGRRYPKGGAFFPAGWHRTQAFRWRWRQ